MFPYLSLVRVGLLCVDSSVGLDVPKGVIHQSTHAAHVPKVPRAVNQLLLAQRNQLSGLPEGLALQRSSLNSDKKF